MNQNTNSTVGAMVAASRDVLRASGFFEAATVTIRRRPSSDSPDASGWANYNYGTIIHSGLSCQFGVMRPKPDHTQTTRRDIQFESRANRECQIDGYYPDILLRDVADVTIVATGVTTRYEIVARDEDSFQTYTRLACRDFEL